MQVYDRCKGVPLIFVPIFFFIFTDAFKIKEPSSAIMKVRYIVVSVQFYPKKSCIYTHF